MRTEEERLHRLDKALSVRQDICSSEGTITDFPPAMKRPYHVSGVGLVVCCRGNFSFLLNQKTYSAVAGETLFIPEDTDFQVKELAEDLEIQLLFYEIEPIREILGNMVLGMHLYSQLVSDPCYVWKTGEEEEIIRYMTLLNTTLTAEDSFLRYEQKLLLLALVHRLCFIYTRKLATKRDAVGRQNDVFIRLIQLIEQYYTKERGVEFYADKLCLSPKYLSAMCKSICGYTVQELVFKSIIRKSISLLKNTRKNVQEISDYFNFPNASYFGTFFKKQVGVSPQQYRKNITA